MSFFPALFSRALTSRNYRIYFAGQLVSLAGTWMQQIAMSWLAYRLSNSAVVLGLIGFATQIPILLLGSFGGVMSDRFDRRRLMMISQSLAMAQALLLAFLTWRGWVTVPWLVGLAFVLGCINALDIPTRQAFSVQLVDRREDLPNAIALNSLLMNATRFVGPTLAGFVLAAFGEEVCFLVNAASYLAVLLALLAIKAPARLAQAGSALAALRDGFAYALSQRKIRGQLLVVATVSFLVTPYLVLMPLFAREILGGDARVFGALVGSSGAGSLVASLYLASRTSTERLQRRVFAAVMVTGAALSLFAANRELFLAFPIVMVMGASIILVIAGSNTLVQTELHDAYRGRVMAIFSMAFLGVAPLGSLTVSAIAHSVGVPTTLVGCGLATMAVGFIAYRSLRSVGHGVP